MNEAELNLILQQAKSENTSPQILEELANHENILVRQAVTENPNTPTNILFDLGAEFPKQFIANTLLDLLLLEDCNFFTKIPFDTLIAILPLEKVPEYFFNWLFQQDEQENWMLILAAIANPKISSATLKKLVNHDYEEVSEAASLHIKYSDKLNSQQEKEKIQEAIKKAPQDRSYYYYGFNFLPWLRDLIPEKIENKLPSRSRAYYRDFKHPLTCQNQNNQNKWAIKYQKNSYKGKLIKKFKHQNWQNCLDRAFAAKNPDTPVKILEQLVADNNKSIRCYAAKNPNLPLYLRQKLAEDKHKSVRANVAKSHHTPASILELLAEPKYGVRHEIARNPNTPVSILIELAKSKHILARRRLAQNPKLPGFILEEFSKLGDDKINDRLAANPNTPPDILQKMAESKSVLIRRKIAKNPGTPSEVLLNLIEDNDYSVLHLIAINPNANTTVLKQLVQYSNSDTLSLILSHPNCTLEVNKHVLNYLVDKKRQTTTDYYVDSYDIEYLLIRLAVFFSNHAEASVLASNARSIYWIERYAIAINPNTPQYIREILSEDSNVIVRNSARSF